jgi:hypothetical protein
MSGRKTPAAPATLYAEALQHEHERHAARLAEIKKLEARLRMLDALAAPLAAHGVRLYPDQIKTHGSDVWLSSAMCDSSGRRMFAAFTAVGFVLDSRRDHTCSSSITLKHGRLRVRMFVDADVLPPPTPEAAAAPDGALRHSPGATCDACEGFCLIAPEASTGAPA